MCLSLCFFLPASAQEGRWKYVGMGANDTVISVDAATMKRNKWGVDVWIQYFRTPKSRVTFKGAPESKTMQLANINCEGRTMATKSFIVYGEDESVLESSTYHSPQWDTVAPDTIGEMVMTAVCSDSAPAAVERSPTP